MSDGGKGSSPRPLSVTRDTFADNWANTFKKPPEIDTFSEDVDDDDMTQTEPTTEESSVARDQYASEEETVALIQPDTRTPEEKRLDKMMDERGAWEQGAELEIVLRQVALQLIAEAEKQEPLVLPPGCTFTPTQCQPLTREVIERDFHGRVDFVRQVEAAHGIKGPV